MTSVFINDRQLLRASFAAIGAALWGGMLLGYYGCVYSPLHAREDAQQARIGELRNLLQNNVNVHTTHHELRAAVEELEGQIATIRRRIPDEPLEATFLSEATSIAHEEQLRIDDFGRLSIETFPNYSEVDVVLQGEGSYTSICRFVHRVSQLDRLSTVRQLSIESDLDENRYPFEVVYSLQFAMTSAIDNATNGEAPL